MSQGWKSQGHQPQLRGQGADNRQEKVEKGGHTS